MSLQAVTWILDGAAMVLAVQSLLRTRRALKRIREMRKQLRGDE